MSDTIIFNDTRKLLHDDVAKFSIGRWFEDRGCVVEYDPIGDDGLPIDKYHYDIGVTRMGEYRRVELQIRQHREFEKLRLKEWWTVHELPRKFGKDAVCKNTADCIIGIDSDFHFIYIVRVKDIIGSPYTPPMWSVDPTTGERTLQRYLDVPNDERYTYRRLGEAYHPSKHGFVKEGTGWRKIG